MNKLMFYHLKKPGALSYTIVNLLRKYHNCLPIIMESCEQRFITRERIATHTHLNFNLKPALYYSTLVIKLFKTKF